jgi:hypothetical protein
MQNQNVSTSNRKWLIFATVVITLLAIYPQINLWLARGKVWHGSYVLVPADQIAYSAYINALIDGRPRRNDPFPGRDDLLGAPLPESLFSIQFSPAYTVAIPGRLLLDRDTNEMPASTLVSTCSIV